MSICVVGLGFVGLSMATVMAKKGLNVIGVENNEQKCSLIKQGQVPFFEPKLHDLLKSILGKNFEIASNLSYAVENSNIIFICVGTPSKTNGSANLTFLEKVCLDLGNSLKNSKIFNVIMIKSTVPPTTTENLVKDSIEKTSGKKSGVDFGICMNPEFMREGSAVEDMLSPHLIVIGTNDERTRNIIHNFYKKFYDKSLPPKNCSAFFNAMGS